MELTRIDLTKSIRLNESLVLNFLELEKERILNRFEEAVYDEEHDEIQVALDFGSYVGILKICVKTRKIAIEALGDEGKGFFEELLIRLTDLANVTQDIAAVISLAYSGTTKKQKEIEREIKEDIGEESGSKEDEDFDLKDSRFGMTVIPPDYDVSIQIPKLGKLCTKVMADNLLLYDGVNELPLDMRSRLFSYLLKVVFFYFFIFSF